LSCGFEADGQDERIKIIDDAVVKAIELRSPLVREFGICADGAKKAGGQRGIDPLIASGRQQRAVERGFLQ
jgi:hypothetical protein